MSELIEKQKVLDALREIATEKFSLDDPYGVYINALIDVEEKICSLPVVQPNGPDNLVKDSQVLAKDLANDTISRQAAIHAICRDGVRLESGGALMITISTAKQWAVDLLGELPSVQTERKRGKWVKAKGSWCTPGGDPVWECSECGKGVHIYGIEWRSYGRDVADGQWVSCPNCGAYMGGGRDDTQV